MVPKTREYYNYLKHKAASTHGDAEPMTEKERKDLELWETIYHYEEVLRTKLRLKQLEGKKDV